MWCEGTNPGAKQEFTNFIKSLTVKLRRGSCFLDPMTYAIKVMVLSWHQNGNSWGWAAVGTVGEYL